MKKWACIIIGILFCYCTVVGQKLNPLDGVKITIYNIQENISGNYFIQKNDILQLPYIGNIETKDLDYEILKQKITKSYKEIYRNPELIIEPLFKINVLGEVNNPGEYYISGVEKLTDIIAKAGGETLDADLSEIIITRDSTELSVDAEQILKDGKSDKDIQILAGDKIYVTKIWMGGARNTSVIFYGLAAVVAAVVTIVTR